MLGAATPATKWCRCPRPFADRRSPPTGRLPRRVAAPVRILDLMQLKSATASLLAAALLTIAACDKATPVAPAGTILSVSANPSRIGLNGTSTVTVFGRKPDGNP